jgi:exodeoxyribonuclease-5
VQLTGEQEKIVEDVRRWVESGAWRDPGAQVKTLSGPAGSGKTVTISAIYDALEAADIVAPTGKACQVLRGKLPSAPICTIHALLYAPSENKDFEDVVSRLKTTPKDSEDYERLLGQFKELKRSQVSFGLRENQEETERLLIVDEASMITDRVLGDMRGTNRPILCVGDSHQLPPVGGNSVFGKQGSDYELTQIHRQALESPVLRLATAIRENRADEAKQYPKTKFSPQEADSADVVLCYTNSTRRSLNRQLRAFHGRKGEIPVEGDQLVCVKNSRTYDWVNGVPCLCISEPLESADEPFRLFDVIYEGERREDVEFHIGDCVANYRDAPELVVPWRDFPANAQAVDFGYALTVHKAQGSEFGKVFLADDARFLMKQGKREFRRRWLYTAITRARDELIWCPI